MMRWNFRLLRLFWRLVRSWPLYDNDFQLEREGQAKALYRLQHDPRRQPGHQDLWPRQIQQGETYPFPPKPLLRVIDQKKMLLLEKKTKYFFNHRHQELPSVRGRSAPFPALGHRRFEVTAAVASLVIQFGSSINFREPFLDIQEYTFLQEFPPKSLVMKTPAFVCT